MNLDFTSLARLIQPISPRDPPVPTSPVLVFQAHGTTPSFQMCLFTHLFMCLCGMYIIYVRSLWRSEVSHLPELEFQMIVSHHVGS